MIKLLSKKSAVGRTVRTLLQAFVGATGFMIVLVTSPGFVDFLTHTFVGIPPLLLDGGTIALFITIVTAAHNAVESLLAKSGNN